jgi:hypothetical protein
LLRAERRGFEPRVPFDPYNRLAICLTTRRERQEFMTPFNSQFPQIPRHTLDLTITIALILIFGSLCSGCYVTAPLPKFIPSPRYFQFHKEEGTTHPVPPRKALLYYFNGDPYDRARVFGVNAAFRIVVPANEFAIAELEVGQFLATAEIPNVPFLDHSATDKVNSILKGEDGQKLFISDWSRFQDGKHDEIANLDRWKPPVAYIKLCNHNSRVCDDSPFKPGPVPTTTEDPPLKLAPVPATIN